MSLLEFFTESYTSDVLLDWVLLCGGSARLTRKAERAEFLARTLTSAKEVQRLWSAMDELSRKAVASAYHNEGMFNPDAFVAQYGALPQRPKDERRSWRTEPILVDVFIQKNVIHPEIMTVLAPLVPPPERFQLSGFEGEPPPVVLNTKQIRCQVAAREEAGRYDLLLFLSLMTRGLLKLSNTSARLTPKSASVLMDGLAAGDFVRGDGTVEDTIICFGLTVFARQAGLITPRGELTLAGKRYLATEDPALLFQAFERWSEQNDFDEITRIEAIRGLRARGLHLTQPAERRQHIVEALSWCPTGVWISISDFYRALKIWHFDFEIEQGGLQKLYVGYRRDYYDAWAPAQSEWLLTTGLYVNAVLWETLATIGAIDVAYVEDAMGVFPAETYLYDEDLYSRYDGLSFFRINPLGAYLFGQAGAYAPSRPADEALFSITADGHIVLFKPESLLAAHQVHLEQIADAAAGGYRLSEYKLLGLLETAPNLELPRSFLEQRHHGPLPDEIKALFDRIESDSHALRIQSQSLTIRVRSAELAQAVLEDPKAGKFARRLDERTLLIPANRENAFRNALREMGYGLAKG